MGVKMRGLVFILLCSMLGLAPAADRAVRAQTQGSPANCDSVVTDPDLKFAEDMCSAHAGCALVVKIQQMCVATKSFFKKLGDLFTLSGRQPLTSNDVMEAASPVPAPNPTLKRYVAQASALAQAALTAPDAPRVINTTSTGTGMKGVWQGKLDAQRKLTGGGVLIKEDGEMWRGQFKDGLLNGPGQVVYTARKEGFVMYTGSFKDGLADGPAARQNSNGSATVGEFVSGRAVGMSTYVYADGRTQIYVRDETGKLISAGPIAAVGQRAVAPPVPTELAARLAVFMESRRAAAAALRAQGTPAAQPAPTSPGSAGRGSAGSSNLRPTDFILEEQAHGFLTVLVGKTLAEALENQVKYVNRTVATVEPSATYHSCSQLVGKMTVGWFALVVANLNPLRPFAQPAANRDVVWGMACDGATVEQAIARAYDAAKKKANHRPFGTYRVEAAVTADLDHARLAGEGRLYNTSFEYVHLGAWTMQCEMPIWLEQATASFFPQDPGNGQTFVKFLMSPGLKSREYAYGLNGQQKRRFGCTPFVNTPEPNQPPPVFGPR